MKRFESVLNWLAHHKDGMQLFLAIPSAIAILAVGAWAAWTWLDQRERELMKPIFEQHMKTTSDIFEVVGKMKIEIHQSPKDDQKLKELSARFWTIYHGPATLYFTTETFQSLQWVAGYVSQCVDNSRDPQNEVNCNLLQMTTSAVAEDARKDITTRLITDGLNGMTRIRAGIPRKLQQ